MKANPKKKTHQVDLLKGTRPTEATDGRIEPIDRILTAQRQRDEAELAHYKGRTYIVETDDEAREWECMDNEIAFLKEQLEALDKKSTPGPRAKTGGRPKSTEGRNRLVSQVMKELNCTASDFRFWPTYDARAEDKLAVPGRKGSDKCKWSKLSSDDRERAHNTVLRQHRDSNS